MTVARVFTPTLNPSAMPAAMAITFFSGPPSSQPTTSSFLYTRNQRELNSGCSERDTWGSGIAITAAAAMPCRISRAMLGPASSPAGCPGSSSAMTWVMRRCVFCSRPFTRLTTGTQGRRWREAASSEARTPCDGTPMTRTSQLDTASSSEAVARSAGFSGKSPR